MTIGTPHLSARPKSSEQIMPSQPRAFRLDGGAVRDPIGGTISHEVAITEEPLDAIQAADGVTVAVAPKKRAPWVGLFFSALGGLFTLGVGLSVERLVADLFAASPWLGWTALALAATALLALLAIVSRELRGVWRERRLEHLRRGAAAALAARDHVAAKQVARELAGLYEGRGPRTIGPRVEDVADEIMDAEDRLALAERTLLAPLDADAKRAIAGAAKQVSVVTALSPRAIVDVAFVIYAGAKLLRRVAAIYGGRPGLIGGLRLARAALSHLALTGGVAVGDSLIQQVLGLGLAARVSAKLGEGVLNGLMTARFGLSALEVCRPLPFIRERPPRIGDVAGELLSTSEEAPAGRPAH
jgi:putative membrane protein